MVKTLVAGLLAAALACGVSHGASAAAAPAPPADGFGVYPPLKGEAYLRYQRQSLYVPVRDGVRLAVDVFRPMTAKAVEDKPLPVVFYYARYWRARQLPDGSVSTNLGILPKGQSIGSLVSRDSSGRLLFWDTGRESVIELMRRGYVFVRAEGRGTGASEGIRVADQDLTEAQDGADLIAWIAKQDWSDGKVGMIGGSYPGIMQLKVAAQAPPALKAIFPAAPTFDLYRLTTAGTGALHKGILGFQASQAKSDGLDAALTVADKVAPVDADSDGSYLAKVLERRLAETPKGATERALAAMAPEFAATVGELAARWGSLSGVAALGTILDVEAFQAKLKDDPQAQTLALKGLSLYRDAPVFSDVETTGQASPHLSLAALNRARIPTYIWSGWYDMDTTGAALLYRNLQGPAKLTLGPWSHGPNEDSGRFTSPLVAHEARARELLTAEAIRWFDYWLKGVDTGVMKDPAVHYGVAETSTRIAWRGDAGWPVSKAGAQKLYLAAAPVGLATAPPARAGQAAFRVDYRASLGPASRYHDSFSGASEMAYPDLDAHAKMGVSFVTAPLEADLLMVGHPVINVQARSTAADGDLFFVLEDVTADGANYVTEAVVRASHRAQGAAPYDVAGLPFSASTRAAVAATSSFNEGLVTLSADMQPTAHLFKKGSRVRLVITGADAENYITTPLSPAPTLTIATGGAQASFISLPTQKIE